MVLAVKRLLIQDSEGNVIPNASVEVLREEPGNPPAAIYSDRDGLTPLANPTTTDANGRVEFYAEGGAYRIEITSGPLNVTLRYEAMGTASEHDADEYGQLQPTLRWQQLVDISNEDLNNVTVNGFYWGFGLGNAPNGSSDGFYIVVFLNTIDPDYVVQLAIDDQTGRIWSRVREGGIWGDWISLPGTSTVNEWTAQQYFGIQTLSDGSNISWDLDTQQVAKVTLGGNRTLSNPTNGKEGGVYILIVTQDGAGGRDLSYGSAYEWPLDEPPAIGEALPNERCVLTFIRENGKMRGVAALFYQA